MRLSVVAHEPMQCDRAKLESSLARWVIDLDLTRFRP
jgi:hypothetical protein